VERFSHIACRLLLWVGVLIPGTASAQERIDWASFPVERETFVESRAAPGTYATLGSFDGVAMLYFSTSKRLIEIKGLKRISIPFLGQEPDDMYEFHHETFTLASMVRTGDGEYAFQATNNGAFDRVATGRLRVTLLPIRVAAKVEEFLMEEHGQAINSVMNRYVLPRSTAAKAMLKTYGEVFFGGNWVAIDPER
jgi:hypothetical protein